MPKEPRIPISRDELLSHEREQVTFLTDYAEKYDAGNTSYAKPMATAIRVLVYNTSQSHALLEQLGIRDKMSWLDTGGAINDGNLVGSQQLVMFRLEADATGGGSGTVVPHLDRWEHRAAPFFPVRYHPGWRARFRDWWEQPVIRDEQRADFTRKDLVQAVANTDGGAHVDAGLEPAYSRLSRSAGFMTWQAGETSGSFGPPVLASIRQIVYETLVSREAYRAEYPDD